MGEVIDQKLTGGLLESPSMNAYMARLVASIRRI